eukprot:1392826-Amorphochlora_amoeboformis.AAC.1
MHETSEMLINTGFNQILELSTCSEFINLRGHARPDDGDHRAIRAITNERVSLCHVTPSGNGGRRLKLHISLSVTGMRVSRQEIYRILPGRGEVGYSYLRFENRVDILVLSRLGWRVGNCGSLLQPFCKPPAL